MSMSSALRTGWFGRVALGFVLLPVSAVVAFSIVWSMADDPLAGGFVLPLALYGAFRLIGIQAVVYSLLMESAVWRVVGANGLGVFVGGLLGLASGALVCRGTGGFVPNVLLGGFVGGLVTALVLRALWKRSEAVDSRGPAPSTADAAPPEASPGTCIAEHGVPQ